MRKLVVMFMIVSFGLTPSLLLAQEKRSKPYSLEFGLKYYYFDYEEELPAPKKSTEEGWLPGFYLGYAYNKKDSAHTKAFLEYSSGDL